MIARQAWFARAFPMSMPAAMLPVIVERLRGTPARLHERLAAVAAATRIRRTGNAWSMQENVGHLLDLEPLWLQRVEQLVAGAAVLAAADLENRATHAAGHNSAAFDELLARFRGARAVLVRRLASLTPEQASRTARHPRLQQPMNAVDLAFFVAEHDDHHLAAISALLGE